MRDSCYWKKESKKLCRLCENGRDNWEHVWEECLEWGDGKRWQEMIGEVLGKKREKESWLKKLDKIREGIRRIREVERDVWRDRGRGGERVRKSEKKRESV